jgi:phage repressor protein C with HTH and peptisase S24 domain
VLPGVREYLEEYDSWEPDENDSINGIVRSSVTEAIKTVNSRLLIETIENFYPHLEVLRREYMPNFIAPNETFKLPVVNSDEKILFSKDFVKRNLNLNKYNDLVLMNITEDNMQGTINIGDLALVIKFQNKDNPILNNGIFAINLNGRLCIRRLQFLKLKQRTLVHIISDNKKYRDDAVAIDELEIYGEVVWKSNSFKDIDFIKHESEEPNLFLPDKDYDIPSFLNNNKKETA